MFIVDKMRTLYILNLHQREDLPKNVLRIKLSKLKRKIVKPLENP